MKPLKLLMVILLISLTTSCAMLKEVDGQLTQRAKNQMEEIDRYYEVKDSWEEKYVRNRLYANMPEEEFIQLFTKTADWPDSQRPYIIKTKSHCYEIYAAVQFSTSKESYKAWLTFESGILKKYEVFGGKVPIWNDLTHTLRNYKK